MESRGFWFSTISCSGKVFVLPPWRSQPVTSDGLLVISFELTEEEWKRLCTHFRELERRREVGTEGLRITHVQGFLVRVSLNAEQAFRQFKTCGAYMVAELVEAWLKDRVKPEPMV